MASASFVEIISHFAGYLQIFHDIARDRLQYDETLAPGRPGDYTTPRPNYDHPFTPDDLDTKGGSVPELIADDAMDVFRGRLPKPSRDSLNPDDDFFPPALNPKVPLPVSGGGGGGGGELSDQGEIRGRRRGDPAYGPPAQFHAGQRHQSVAGSPGGRANP